jgi:hypothetical protein
MDSISLYFTHSARSVGTSPRFFLRCFPSTSPRVSSSACPPWMVFLPDVFRLPFSHAAIITKRLFGMEITGGAHYVLSAIIAPFCNLILWLTMLISSPMVTRSRAIDTVKALKGLKCFPTSRTFFFDGMNFVFESRHKISLIIKNTLSRVGIEIEEKYCQIAVDRLRQGVLGI